MQDREEIVEEITVSLENIRLMAKLSKIAVTRKAAGIDYDLVFNEIEKCCQNISAFVEDLEKT